MIHCGIPWTEGHHEAKYGMSVKEKYGCISEDNLWFLKMDYRQIGTDHQEQIDNDKAFSKKRQGEKWEKYVTIDDGFTPVWFQNMIMFSSQS